MTRCLICRSKFREIYEEMYRKKIPVTKIYWDALRLEGKVFSIRPFYHHFSKHYNKEDKRKEELLTDGDVFRLLIRTRLGKLTHKEQLGFIRWYKKFPEGTYIPNKLYDRDSAHKEILRVLNDYNPKYIPIFKENWVNFWNTRNNSNSASV